MILVYHLNEEKILEQNIHVALGQKYVKQAIYWETTRKKET